MAILCECQPHSDRSRLRYRVILNVSSTQHDVDSVPVTYLHQGRSYQLSILDSTVNPETCHSPQYQTLVGVYFGHGQRKADHDARLRRWNDQLPVNAAVHARSLRPVIEYATDGHNGCDQSTVFRMHASDVALDSFQVQWTPNQLTGGSYCVIPFKLNFLNEGFSCKEAIDSKAVTLFVRTQEMSSISVQACTQRSEGCLLEVNLFFNCSAEQRYLADCQSVGTPKVELPTSQRFPVGTPENGAAVPMRTPNTSSPEPPSSSHGFKAGAISLFNDNQPDQHRTAEEHWEGATVQRACVYTRPVSIFVRAQLQESPHQDSWTLLKSINEVNFAMRPKIVPRTPTGYRYSELAPVPETDTYAGLEYDLSMQNRLEQHHPCASQTSIFQERAGSNPQFISHKSYELSATLHRGIRATKASCDSTGTSSSAAALDTRIKPAVCFYVRLGNVKSADHRAIYLLQRSMGALIAGIATKFKVPPDSVTEIFYLDKDSVPVPVDDYAVRHLPDGQDMLLRLPGLCGSAPAPATMLLPPVPWTDQLGISVLSDAESQTIQSIDELGKTDGFLDLLDFESEYGPPEIEQSNSPAGALFLASPTSYHEPLAIAPLLLENHPIQTDFTLWPSSATALSSPHIPIPESQLAAISLIDTSHVIQIQNSHIIGHKRCLAPELDSPHKKARNNGTSPTPVRSPSSGYDAPPPHQGSTRSCSSSSASEIFTPATSTSPHPCPARNGNRHPSSPDRPWNSASATASRRRNAVSHAPPRRII